LPGQTLDNWKYNLEKSVRLQTQHISAYSLIFEEGTTLFDMRKSGRVSEADVELEAEMFDYTSEFLTNWGFGHYEISNFAKPDYECRHNLKYWQREEYIAFGPSASSFVGSKRWTNVKNLTAYINSVESGKLPVGFEEEINEETAIISTCLGSKRD
jgi:oxygen-independent coproporphyrinogen-3 oxidase